MNHNYLINLYQIWSIVSFCSIFFLHFNFRRKWIETNNWNEYDM